MLSDAELMDVAANEDNITREQAIEWLVWNDRNGCYTDEDSINEGLEPLTLGAARLLVRAQIADLRFCRES